MFDTVSSEPVWKSKADRIEAYEMVSRMFLGINEWEGTTNIGIDIGLEGR